MLGEYEKWFIIAGRGNRSNRDSLLKSSIWERIWGVEGAGRVNTAAFELDWTFYIDK